MDDIFVIRHRLDKVRDDSIVTIIFELLAVVGISWLVLFLTPILLGAKSHNIRHDDTFIGFILDLYNNPQKYYAYLTIFSVFCGLFYSMLQIKFNIIVSIVIENSQVKFVITNRFGIKYKRKYCDINDVKSKIEKSVNNECKCIKFYCKKESFGYFYIRNIKRLTVKEKELIEIINNKWAQRTV